MEELKKLNYPVELKCEITIPYRKGLSKKVDFAITYKERIRFGIEVNFYTVTGSKPTEIKRSYGNVLNDLQRIGIDLIWITDGKGYRGMRRSLKDAYTILPNIYNLQQAKINLLTDFKTVFAIETIA